MQEFDLTGLIDFNPKKIEQITENGVNSIQMVQSSKNDVEPMVIGGAATTSTNTRHQEMRHKMIERIKEYHSKLDMGNHEGKGKLDLYVCSICFDIHTHQDLLRDHYIKVGKCKKRANTTFNNIYTLSLILFI